MHVAKLLIRSIEDHAPIPLQISPYNTGLSAADAFATDSTAGIGGWWLPTHCRMEASNVKWFRLDLDRCSLPGWFKVSNGPSLQKCIAALEALAQVVLLLLQVQQADAVAKHVVLQFSQLCDNAGVTAASAKMLSQSEPLCWVLQCLGYYCCKHSVSLSLSHIAGIRNTWADSLSRGDMPSGFLPRNRILLVDDLSVAAILHQPWR